MKKINWWLLTIVTVALVLRLWQLNQVPPALFGDEIDVGYQAYSLLKTGRDLQGQFLPFYIHSLSEYRAPFLIYSTVPTVAVFGLNEWGVRLPAVIWGMISLFGMYLLTKRLFNEKVALAVALMVAITPWHLQYSRAAFEVTMLMSFIVWGSLWFINHLKQPKQLIAAGAILGLTPYIYSTAVVFVPLWVMWLIFVYRHEIFNRNYFKKMRLVFGLTAAAIVIVGLPAVYSMLTGVARERFNTISIFQDTVLIDKLNLARKGSEYIDLSGQKQTIDAKSEYLFHNKPLVFGQVFSQNYFQAISPYFLFAYGDPIFRHHIQEMGMLYFIQALLLIIGVGYLIKSDDKKIAWLIFGWLLLSPIPSAMTQGGGNHATRLFLMVPPLMLLTGIGFERVIGFRWKGRYLAILAVSGLLLVQTVFYLHRYYLHYPIESWRWWHVGFKEAMTEVASQQEQYQTVIINNSYEPSLIRYLYFTGYDPAVFQQQFEGDKSLTNVVSGIDGFKLGQKLVFGQINDEGKKRGGLKDLVKPGVLYLASARDDTEDQRMEDFKIIKTIYNPLGQPIFYLISGNK